MLMYISTDDWVRFPDVELYAEKHQISLVHAVIELVNKGLSHWEFGDELWDDSFLDDQDYLDGEE